MKEKKYIMVDDIFPIVFHPFLTHGDMRSHTSGIVTSAGFCSMDDAGIWSCYGESVSLKLKSNPRDSKILNKF